MPRWRSVATSHALCGLIALPIKGASMNPARSAGPALVSGDLGDLWIYVLGPVIGASLAVFLTRFLHGRTPEVDGTAEEAARGESLRAGQDRRPRGPGASSG